MKHLRQLVIILLFTALGQALEALLPLPIPAAIYGLVLMLLCLCTGLLKADAIRETAQFLIKIMAVFFVAPAVNILEHWGILAPRLGTVITVMAVSTVVVFAVSGLVTQALLRKKEDGENG